MGAGVSIDIAKILPIVTRMEYSTRGQSKYSINFCFGMGKVLKKSRLDLKLYRQSRATDWIHTLYVLLLRPKVWEALSFYSSSHYSLLDMHKPFITSEENHSERLVIVVSFSEAHRLLTRRKESFVIYFHPGRSLNGFRNSSRFSVLSIPATL